VIGGCALGALEKQEKEKEKVISVVVDSRET